MNLQKKKEARNMLPLSEWKINPGVLYSQLQVSGNKRQNKRIIIMVFKKMKK